MEKLSNKEFGKILERRTLNFSIQILKMSSLINDKSSGKIIINQIVRSATSIGANYREANMSRSNADFLNKLKICQSETNETLYWLEIIEEMNWLKGNMIVDLKIENKELLAIFTSIINKIKNK